MTYVLDEAAKVCRRIIFRLTSETLENVSSNSFHKFQAWKLLSKSDLAKALLTTELSNITLNSVG